MVETLAPRYGIECTLVDGRDLDNWEAAIRPNTKVFFLESPTNPTLEVVDIAGVARLANQIGAKVVVDNVFATPLFQKPLELGAAYRRLFGDQAYRRPGPLPRRRRSVATRSGSTRTCTTISAIPVRPCRRSMPGCC